jgi:hypothetical protein
MMHDEADREQSVWVRTAHVSRIHTIVWGVGCAVLSVVLLATTYPLLAQEDSDASATTDIRATTSVERNDVPQSVTSTEMVASDPSTSWDPVLVSPKPNVQNGTAKVVPKNITRGANLLENILSRLTEATSRLSSITDRIERRIEKLGREGVDVTSARETLSSVRSILRETEGILGTLIPVESSVVRVLTAENPAQAFQTLASDIARIQENLVSVKKSLGILLTQLETQSSEEVVPPVISDTQGASSTSILE